MTLFNAPVGAGDTITLNGLAGNDTINIEHTFAGVPVTANGGNDNDTVNVSPTSRFLDNIVGEVLVNGGIGTDTLNIFDQNNPFSDTFTESGTSVERDFSEPVSYSAIDVLNVNSGTGAVTHNVEGTASGVTTTITGNSDDDVFNISPVARNFGNIDGNLIVNGAGGTDSLIISDQNNLASSIYTVTGTTVARSLSATVSYSSMNGGVVINGGPGGLAGTVTYDINSTSTNNPVTINAGAGNDVAQSHPVGRNLDLLDAPVTFHGGGGVNTLNVNDQNNPNSDTFTTTLFSLSRTNAAQINYDLVGTDLNINAGTGNNLLDAVSGPLAHVSFHGGAGLDTLLAPPWISTFDITGLNAGTLNTDLSFSFVENLRGNIEADAFEFGASGVISGTVNGQGGTDTLDYSARTAAVSVNLLNGTATFTGGVSNIEDVAGGSGNDTLIGSVLANDLQGNGGNDILVGNGGNDTIDGDTGRDVVIGGTGSDTLEGSGEDDILIDGTTSFDANVPALQAILSEWASAKSYANRVINLQTGGGLNGAIILKATGAGQTVFDDAIADTLTGDLGLDWFFTAAPDPFPLLDPGEQVN